MGANFKRAAKPPELVTTSSRLLSWSAGAVLVAAAVAPSVGGPRSDVDQRTGEKNTHARRWHRSVEAVQVTPPVRCSALDWSGGTDAKAPNAQSPNPPLCTTRHRQTDGLQGDSSDTHRVESLCMRIDVLMCFVCPACFSGALFSFSVQFPSLHLSVRPSAVQSHSVLR